MTRTLRFNWGESNLRTHGPKFRTFPSKVTRGLHPTSSSNPRVGTQACTQRGSYSSTTRSHQEKTCEQWARPRRTTWCILFDTFTAFIRTGEGIDTAHRDSEDIGCIAHPLSVGRAPITARVSTPGPTPESIVRIRSPDPRDDNALRSPPTPTRHDNSRYDASGGPISPPIALYSSKSLN